MIKRVVIFGGHIQALGLARQVKAKRLEVVLIVEDKYQVARFSRSVSKTYICPTIEEQLKMIDELELPNKGTMLFPTNDEAVEMLCGRYEEYKERFALGVPEPKVIELFNDKRRAYRFAEASGVHCPKCWYPDTMEEVEALSKGLPYPVVVKPAVMYSFHATFGKKAFRCDDAASLKATYTRIAAKGYPLETLVVQEFLDGGAKNLYSCGVMAAGGEIIVSMQANRIRQNPMDFGNSTTYAISCFVPEIQEQTEALLRMVGYNGVGEVEWMWDAKAQQYKFLEINTRAWKWHTISNQLGFSFIGALIDFFNGEENSENKGENIKNTCLTQKEESQVTCSNSTSLDPQSAHEQAPGQSDAQSCSDTDKSYLQDSSEKNTDVPSLQKSASLPKKIYADEKQVAWCERLTDWTVVAKEILHGRMTLKDVCASYKIKHESAVWSWKDPLPAIMYIVLSPILYVKRH
jgi:predicted ATP-grasp superfamily ATP-dependent carboligase